MHVYNMRSPTWQNICEAQTLLCPLAFSFKVSLQSIVSSQKVTYMFTNMPLLFHLCSETYLFTESSHSSDGTHGSLTAILNWNWQKMSSVFFFPQMLFLDFSSFLPASLHLPALHLPHCRDLTGALSLALALLLWMLMTALSSIDFLKHRFLPQIYQIVAEFRQ